MKTITKSLFVLTIAFCFVIGAGQDEAFSQRKGGNRGGKSVSQKQLKSKRSRPSKMVSPQLGNKKNKGIKGKKQTHNFDQNRRPGMRQASPKGINGVRPSKIDVPNLQKSVQGFSATGDRARKSIDNASTTLAAQSQAGLNSAANNYNQRRPKAGQSVTLTGSTISGNFAATDDLYQYRRNRNGQQQSSKLFTRPATWPQKVKDGDQSSAGFMRGRWRQVQSGTVGTGHDIEDAPIGSKTATSSILTNNENMPFEQRRNPSGSNRFEIYDAAVQLKSKVGSPSILTNNENSRFGAKLNQTRSKNAANPTSGVTIPAGQTTRYAKGVNIQDNGSGSALHLCETGKPTRNFYEGFFDLFSF